MRPARAATGSQRSRMWRGHTRGELNISTTNSPWPPPMSWREFSPHVFALKKVDGSRLGGCCRGPCLCNRSSSTMWLHGCASTLRGKNRVTQGTRTKTCNLALLLSPTTIIKLLSTGGERLSYRQPESGGSPISFVHFATSFSAEPILPPGWVRPVPVLLRLGSTEASEMKGLEVDADNFSQPGLCISHIWAKQHVQQVLPAPSPSMFIKYGCSFSADCSFINDKKMNEKKIASKQILFIRFIKSTNIKNVLECTKKFKLVYFN